MMGLTVRQSDCLRFISQELGDRGRAPTMSEICDELGLRSKNCAHRIVSGLEDRGLIRRLPGKARAIELVKEGQQSEVLAFLDADVRDCVMSHARRLKARPEEVINAALNKHFFLNARD